MALHPIIHLLLSVDGELISVAVLRSYLGPLTRGRLPRTLAPLSFFIDLLGWVRTPHWDAILQVLLPLVVLIGGPLGDHDVRILDDEVVAGPHVEFQSLRRRPTRCLTAVAFLLWLAAEPVKRKGESMS